MASADDQAGADRREAVRPALAGRLLWFAGLWIAGVAAVGAVALIIKLVLNG